MKLRTIDNGDFTILMEGQLRSPYPILSHEVFIDKERADYAVVSSQITCHKDGKVYKGYHLYLLKEVSTP